MNTTDHLSQLVVLLIPVLFVWLLAMWTLGIRPGPLGWLFVFQRRRRRGLLARLSDRSLLQKLVVQSLAMADVALLALSASTLAALGLQGQTTTRGVMAAVAVTIIGLCLLLVVRLVDDPFGGIILFGAASVVTLRVAQIGHEGLPLLAFGALIVALLAPWPVGLILLLIELVTLTQEYGLPVLTMVLALIAALTALGFLIQAVRGSVIVVVAGCALVAFAVVGAASFAY
jgi:hypothetical protein